MAVAEPPEPAEPVVIEPAPEPEPMPIPDLPASTDPDRLDKLERMVQDLLEEKKYATKEEVAAINDKLGAIEDAIKEAVRQPVVEPPAPPIEPPEPAEGAAAGEPEPLPVLPEAKEKKDWRPKIGLF